MTIRFLLTFERQLDKVKTRLTTLYVVQKSIITAKIIIDQLKLTLNTYADQHTH